MIWKLIISIFTLAGISMHLLAQTDPYAGSQNRVVVFVRFDGDPELDTPRSNFENMFNGEENSLKAYFKAISNDKLTLSSLLYPANNGVNSSFELKYCYYCYESDWKGNYPNCKGNDITTLFDINIGFILKELAGKLEMTEDIPDASALDSDNDGNIDNFVIVFRGAARGNGKGIYSPQVGTVSETFTKAHGSIQLKGKTINKYTITFERNSLETHSRFQLKYMGFPAQYRSSGTYLRSVGAWDPLDGPELSYPLVYNRMKYTNNSWITAIPEITETGEYTLSSADNADDNAYKLFSSDGRQYWILEYRDNTVAWERNLPGKGLIIYRVDTRYTGSVSNHPEVYVYRQDGTSAVAGDLTKATFSDTNGRTAFNATTNPCSFLTDGSVFDELDISDISFKGDKMSFRINKVSTAIQMLEADEWKVYVDTDSRSLSCEGTGIESVSLFDLSGKLISTFNVEDNTGMDLSGMSSGVYIARLKGKNVEKRCKFVL